MIRSNDVSAMRTEHRAPVGCSMLAPIAPNRVITVLPTHRGSSQEIEGGQCDPPRGAFWHRSSIKLHSSSAVLTVLIEHHTDLSLHFDRVSGEVGLRDDVRHDNL